MILPTDPDKRNNSSGHARTFGPSIFYAPSELSKLGLSSPPGKKALEDPDQAEKIWAMAFLYDRAGKFGPSHWVMRWHVLSYKRHWPRGEWRVFWDVAFPQAWWNLISEWGSLSVSVQRITS